MKMCRVILAGGEGTPSLNIHNQQLFDVLCNHGNIEYSLQHVYVTYAYSYIIIYTILQTAKVPNSKPVPKAGVIFNKIFTKNHTLLFLETSGIGFIIHLCIES